MNTTYLEHLLALLERLPLFWVVSRLVQRLLVAVLATGPLPQHVAFIMDGNRRFAQKNNLRLADGHDAGLRALVQVSSPAL